MVIKPSFASDNNAGIHPEILKALEEANHGDYLGYGDDPWTKKLEEKCRKLFGAKSRVFPVFTGTAANILSIMALTRSYHSVAASDVAHLNHDECGGPEKFGGVKVLSIPSDIGKIRPQNIEPFFSQRAPHQSELKVISLTQPTELGSLYTPDEIKSITLFARKHGLFVMMDGARIANAAVALKQDVYDFTGKLGIDVLSFGGTKNGMLAGEMLVFFNQELAKGFEYYRKQFGQLASKMRFLSAQFLAYFKDDLWLKLAAHANQMAHQLEQVIKPYTFIQLAYPRETNGLFPVLPEKLISFLQKKFEFYLWDEQKSIVRWMTSFTTQQQEIDEMALAIKEWKE